MFEIVISKKAFDMLLKAANMPKQIGDGSNADNAVKEFAKKILSETKAIDMTAKQRQSDGRIIRDIPDEVLAMAIREFVDERMKIVDKEIINGTGDKEPIGVILQSEDGEYTSGYVWAKPFKEFAYRKIGEKHD